MKFAQGALPRSLSAQGRFRRETAVSGWPTAWKFGSAVPTMPLKLLTRLGAIYLLGACFGWTFAKLGVPLPWMIGPVISTAFLYLTGIASSPVPVETRPFGQVIVASTVGLYFTPTAFGMLLGLAPLIVGVALMTAVLAFAAAWVQARLTGGSFVSALVATFPTSPVEAAIIAEQHDVSPAPAVVAQTIRIGFVVVFVPIALFVVDGWPDRGLTAIENAEPGPLGLLIVMFAGVAGSLLFVRLRTPIPFFLGPLAVVSACAATSMPLSPFPGEVLAAAQVLLGTWLGSTFRRELLKDAPRLIGASILTTALLLAFNSAGAIAIALILNMDWETLVLAAAPGGVTEMALTAKYLDKDVALITAFHLVRIFLLMLNLNWIVRLVHHMENRKP